MSDRGSGQKQILVIALKKDAQPVLGQLRGAGHRVSLVEDMDEAQALLGSGGFEQVILPAAALGTLLEQSAAWESAEVDHWRRTVSGLALDLENLLTALRGSIVPGDGGLGSGPTDDARHTISVLCGFLQELTAELGSAPAHELRLAMVDLEDSIEAAAVTVYPSATERRQRLVINVEEQVSCVRADEVKLKRMLSGLLKYASSRTPIQGRVAVHAYQEGEEPVISISYEGGEMTRSDLRRLFSPGAEEESSAGLSRVRRLAEQHECRVWLESQRGAGTSIFLALPWWSSTPTETVAAPARS
jgi:signal transduction histidine kinase